MTNYNDGKWHGWNGGECPVHPGTVVEVFYDGQCEGPKVSSSFVWRHDGDGFSDILAFRVVKEHKEPREFWVHPYANDVLSSPTLGYIHVREVIE